MYRKYKRLTGKSQYVHISTAPSVRAAVTMHIYIYIYALYRESALFFSLEIVEITGHRRNENWKI